MPDVRRCTIFGCKSNSRDNKELKFFNFPPRDNPLYEIWVSVCEESELAIRSQRRPYICSRHFFDKDVGFRRLATGAVPSKFLTAPPGFIEEENARMAEAAAARAEKERIVTLVNDVVLEWVKRALHYLETSTVCTTRRELRRIATEARNLLGATLTMSIDDYWLRKFRQSHMYQLELKTLNEKKDMTLDLVSIIRDVDPNAKISSEDEIALLIKEEREQAQKMELKRSIARANKLSDAGDIKCTKNGIKLQKMEREDSLDDFVSVVCVKNESTYSSNSEVEQQSDCDVSIDLSQEDFEQMETSEEATARDGKTEVTIDTYKEALGHLAPLEDFALRVENYRVIGLLSTLESIFKKHDEIEQKS